MTDPSILEVFLYVFAATSAMCIPLTIVACIDELFLKNRK